ncbi:MAG: heavy metal translocating P-type ATPase [Pseudobutyrivibrio sp.]|uniref:heavy metal translocating P-type ATPase n=1 Tax=Pseudobutyrivibrio sp. TaxID=2014367 RepID=UPI0025DEFF78|nr:heavy metal translocating P-type ATPase [Pseudobutyrivibrio sp.]MBQ6461694.1 heavy metal translocating P-type ATPase [Pseudobutyrivibrio sp.]
MKQYNVTGMSCAACQARVEKAVSAVPGVDSCAVSLLTNSMGVEGSADAAAIIKAVEDAGYGASVKAGEDANSSSVPNYDNDLKDTETPKIRNRLIASVIILLPLMYVTMGHMMWGWPLPGFLDGNHIAMGIYELILAATIMVINQRFFISGFKGLMHRAPNMDTLVAMGSAASFIYSVYALFAMTSAQLNGDSTRVMELMDEFYFESAAMILTLITVGKLLEAISKGRTTNALKDLMKLAAKTAVILVDGVETEVPIEQVKIGDRFVVRPGDNIPVDGVVIEGSSAVNEAALTGESIPVDKAVGDTVSAATSNESGYMVCEATRVGKDTTLSQIIQMVSDAAATKAPIAKIADRVSGVFVPAVIIVAIITFVIWMLVGQPVGYALARAISVLVISCPCALGLATPVAIMVGNGMGAKNGIMFKTAVSLEETGKTQIVALDKTGTITKGEPKVIGVFEAEGIDDVDLVRTAFALESKSEHPLAKAIVEHGLEDGMEPADISDFKAHAGSGLSATLDGENIYGGNGDFIKKYVDIDEESLGLADTLANKGETPLFFAKGNRFLGIISVADVIKDDSPEAIRHLKNMGIHVVMLTGDNEKTAQAIAKEAGVDEVISGVKPDGKEEVIRKLQEFGKVAMVGDGINDAPALTRADIGIAIGAGTDVAIDAADVVVVKSRLSDVAAAIRLSKATLKNIHENLFWAFFYNIIGIPLAAGAYIHAFGWTLNPMFGAAAMSLSSFCVVTNALRLNLFKMHDSSKDKPMKNTLGHDMLVNNTVNNKEENNTMEITVKGMMCQHCEAHVKEALEKIAGVEEATANHEANLVTLKTSADVAESDLKAAVEAAGYEYVGIK